jgi:hypothetical protein
MVFWKPMLNRIAPVLALMFSYPAWACSPAHGPEHYTDARNTADADVIFVGHITRVEEIPASPRVLATYRLVQPLKGHVPKTGTIITSYSNCHVALLPGGKYVLFADAETGRLSVKPGFAGTRDHLPSANRSATYLQSIKQHLASNKAPSHP